MINNFIIPYNKYFFSNRCFLSLHISCYFLSLLKHFWAPWAIRERHLLSAEVLGRESVIKNRSFLDYLYLNI